MSEFLYDLFAYLVGYAGATMAGILLAVFIIALVALSMHAFDVVFGWRASRRKVPRARARYPKS